MWLLYHKTIKVI